MPYAIGSPFIILGDINDNLFDLISKLKCIVNNLKLTQIIDKPTRITATSATLLDVIITNTLDKVCEFNVSPCQISDHELISVRINLEKPKRQPEYKTFRCLRNYSPQIFCNHLLDNSLTLNSI